MKARLPRVSFRFPFRFPAGGYYGAFDAHDVERMTGQTFPVYAEVRGERIRLCTGCITGVTVVEDGKALTIVIEEEGAA